MNLSELYDPPVERKIFEADREIAAKDFIPYLQEKLALDETTVSRIVWHGGVFLGKYRIDLSQKGFKIEKGNSLEVYRFLREPSAIPIADNQILFETKDFLAVNKPAWLPVQATRASLRFSLEAALQQKMRLPGLMAVHRLDRQTSGVILFSKNPKAANVMMEHFAAHRTLKRYFALVSSPLPDAAWETTGYLVRDFKRLPQIYYRLFPKAIRKEARFSRTFFRRLGIKGNKTLVEAIPETGRTHQIRVHLTAKGFPILGDTLYGKKNPDAGRVQLHAFELRFPHWANGQKSDIKIKAPLPEDFEWKGPWKN